MFSDGSCNSISERLLSGFYIEKMETGRVFSVFKHPLS